MSSVQMTAAEQYNIHSDHQQSFEMSYIRLRKKEGRLCTDEELALLPDISSHHIYAREWEMRKESFLRYKKYLAAKPRPLTILEVGCGNGWLSRRLAEIPLSNITGTDINQTELCQAKRVFSHVANLTFLHGGLDAAELTGKNFDQVVFASSIQYFPSVKKSIITALNNLSNKGEIHILDSPLYQPHQLKAAAERTRAHFLETGFPEMAERYYHHSIDDLDMFEYDVLYTPGFINKYFLGRKNPFPWVRIKKQ